MRALTALLLAIAVRGYGAETGPVVVCRLIGNDTPATGLCTWELSLTSDDGAPAPIPEGATLYFNFNRLPAEEAERGDVVRWKDAVRWEHVNGDLFRIPPERAASGREPARLTLVAKGAIRNLTDAPAGFFLVEDDSADTDTATDLCSEVDLTVLAGGRNHPSSGGVAQMPNGVSPHAPFLPQPARYTRSVGWAPVAGLPIVAGDEHAVAAGLIAGAIADAGHAPPSVAPAVDLPAVGIRLRVDPSALVGMPTPDPAEAYRLSMTPDAGIEVVGGGVAGVFYGAQSLIALLEHALADPDAPGWNVRAGEVLDYPRFAYRGLHLDVARNFQSVATVKRLLDRMAAYKLNRFHFHLTDDEGWRLAIDGLPELTEVGGRRGYTPGFRTALPPSFGSGAQLGSAAGSGHYTRAEFKDLLRYAADRHITVIPEIDLPGHARAAIRSMQVRYERLNEQGRRQAARQYLLREPADPAVYRSVQLWDDNVVDVRLPSTNAFVEHVVADVAAMYCEAGLTLDRVHFGGDEVPKSCWGESEEEQQVLFNGFMRGCAAIAARHGAGLAGWEEVFLHGSDSHDSPSDADGAHPPGVAYAWNNIWGWGQEDAAYRLANAGTDVVLCNATHLYFDLARTPDHGEPGYYWAGTTDLHQVFHFSPYRYFETLTHDRLGNEVSTAAKTPMTRLQPAARKHVLGMQGHLWGENLTSPERLEYLAFPRVLALAERAWRGPLTEPPHDGVDRPRPWAVFAHVVADELTRRKPPQRPMTHRSRR